MEENLLSAAALPSYDSPGTLAPLVEQVLARESADVRAVYSRLPYGGSPDEQEACLRLLYRHSRDVADLAVALALSNPRLALDLRFVEKAALLHDVGVVLTNAPGIHCFGTEPYIRHGELGAELLRACGLTGCALVAQRHTGAGISADDIAQQNLPLLEPGLPETAEEKLVCYADKFFSKSHPERRKTLDQARSSLRKFGAGTMARFELLVELFGSAEV